MSFWDFPPISLALQGKVQEELVSNPLRSQKPMITDAFAEHGLIKNMVTSVSKKKRAKGAFII